MPEFKAKVVNRPAFEMVGMKVRTNMETAALDCPKLWNETFGPRMAELPLEQGSYGLSFMLDEKDNSFDYWAAVPWAAGQAIPPGMEKVAVPAGLYVECQVPSLNALQLAYQYIFFEWLVANGGQYEPDAQAPSCEFYPADFMQSGRLALYFPVAKI